MILSYDLIKKEDIINLNPVQEPTINESPTQEQDPQSSQTIDSSSETNKAHFTKTHSISSSVSKQEDYFLQKDLLNMINSFSMNDSGELIQKQSINSLMGNNNNDYDNSFNSECNDKVIDIKEIPPFEDDQYVNQEDETKEEQDIDNEEEYDQSDINDENSVFSPHQSQEAINKENVVMSQLRNSMLTVNKQAILNNYNTFDNSELAKWSYILSKDQKACLLLQSKLDDHSEMADMLYNNLKDRIIDLMYGGFSNYFIQKLIDKLAIKQIEEIIIQIINSNSFSILGLDPHGTRVIQKIIERIKNTTKLLCIITRALLHHINQFIIDSNANHIIIKYASIVKYPKNQVIYDYLMVNILQVSHDKNSCCALQKCIEVANDQQKEDLFAVIGQNANIMISDNFGNYALQFIIPLSSKDILNQIVNSFLDNVDAFALNKYASNVIEKCIEYSQNEIKLLIIQKFINEQSIMNLLFNKYGNYVLQTILSYAPEPILAVILTFIEKYSKQLSCKKYGQKFLSKLRKSYPQLRTNDINSYHARIYSNNSNYYMNMNINTMNNCTNTNPSIDNNKRLLSYNACDGINYKNTPNIMNQDNYRINMKHIPSNPSMMMNYNNNQFNNALYSYYNANTQSQIPTNRQKHTPVCSNQQSNLFFDNEKQQYNNYYLYHQKKQQIKMPLKNSAMQTNKNNKTSMNINIAVNNYYNSPVYNYYSSENELAYSQKYYNNNKNGNKNNN